MAKKFLTLNIGAANVELAEYEAGAKGALTLVNYGIAPLAAPLDVGNAETILSPAILQIVREKGIRPGSVAISISGQLAFPRVAAIAPTGGDEHFEQMVRFEIEQNIPFPIDEIVCDRQVLGDTPGGDKSVLIVAAKIDQIESITSAVISPGFTPEIVDIAPLALVNVLAANRPDEGCVIVLDLGAKTTSLAIAEGDRIYNRSIPVAGNTIVKEIASVLGCTPEEAEKVKCEKGYVSLGGVTEDEDKVADSISKVCRSVLTRLNAEVSRSINFYRSQQGGSAPVKLYLTGGTSMLPQLDQFFAESLGMEVEYLNPLETVAVGPRVDGTLLEAECAQIATTIGLALHMTDRGRFAINLLPPSLVATRAEKAKIPFIVVAGVALLAGLGLVWFSVSGDKGVIDERCEEVAAQADALSRVDKDVTAAQTALAEKEEEAAELGRLIESRTAAIRRLWAVSKAIDGRHGTWIDRWDAAGVTVRQWNYDTSRSAAGKTAAESIVSAICGNDTNVIDAASVKITAMSEIGKHADVKQFTVEFKNK